MMDAAAVHETGRDMNPPKPKWTPGPWEVDTSGKYCSRDCVRHNGIVVALIGHNTGGYVRQQDVDAQLEAEQANASLIAAAPQMYEALESGANIAALILLHWDCGDLATVVRTLAQWECDARAALRAARECTRIANPECFDPRR